MYQLPIGPLQPLHVSLSCARRPSETVQWNKMESRVIEENLMKVLPNGSHGLGGGIQAAGCFVPVAGAGGAAGAPGEYAPGNDGDTGEGDDIVDAGGTLTT
jgi:hypothetical protein